MTQRIKEEIYLIIRNSNISYKDRIRLYRALEKSPENLD